MTKKILQITAIATLVLSSIYALLHELKYSTLQSVIFNKIAAAATYEVKDGNSNSIRFPNQGPFDERYGYTSIPKFSDRLTASNFQITSQAVTSWTYNLLVDLGIYPIYREKERAGIEILDMSNRPIFENPRPTYYFHSFSEIPKIIIDTLLFIENREILDQNAPYKNPAIEWNRLSLAIYKKLSQLIFGGSDSPGGSTIATQLEKYRHSFEGRTRNAKDKLLQIVSASTRSYLDNRDTSLRRQQIVKDYINSIPLAAKLGYGEVYGLGDGLKIWYGVDLETTRDILSKSEQNLKEDEYKNFALAYKQVLSLFLAHRRPSIHLLRPSQHINQITDDYLKILERDQIISTKLMEQARQIPLELNNTKAELPSPSFVERKATNAIRKRLLTLLGYQNLYELDQLDLSVTTSINGEINQKVSEILMELQNREGISKYKLNQDRLLAIGDPKKVYYSFTLFEQTPKANLLRIHTDNIDQPFDLNDGARLDLGSTAKLRTLASYLEVIAALWQELKEYPAEKLTAISKQKNNPLRTFVAQSLINGKNLSLLELLSKAMERKYSANTGETFFTGGGSHTFSNFKPEDNGRIVTVKEALSHSINLPFIRIMRDIVKHYENLLDGSSEEDPQKQAERRTLLLSKFADSEGKIFLREFYNKYKGLSGEDVLKKLFKNRKNSPRKYSVVYQFIYGDRDLKKFNAWTTRVCDIPCPEQTQLERALKDLDISKFSFNEQGYLAKLHPLELWLVKYLVFSESPSFNDLIRQSRLERIAAYSWLFAKNKKKAQDIRIRSLIEAEAFREIHKQWRQVGYPYRSMVPSLASAIGSSGDRPGALAELTGIIISGGYRMPSIRIKQLRFAVNTPFETNFTYGLEKADSLAEKYNQKERVMTAEVADILKEALIDVVENGTARRLRGVLKDSANKKIVIGGKTGTGDHRFDTYGAGGKLISSRVVNRTATFLFFIGNRFFGAVTAHVQGAEAAKYNFTSALAADVLRATLPVIQPLVSSN
ncbi:MAG TPA: transglycosylase domain-containing protein [Oligoflexia bacterium]|nr:transglycosylase domain-containing protein [Oligoflexia bacterium]HMP27139.1 transglycosylase domain-containing protein [Oligoflexia bacterium]